MLRLNEEIGILNGLVTQGSEDGTNRNVSNSFNCYRTELALFTALPNIAGTNPTEVSLSGYSRVPLTGDGIGGHPKFGVTAAFNDGTYKISNTAPIQMHAIDEDESEEEIVLGFGIYAAEKSETGAEKRLVAWGPLVDNDGNPVTDTTAPKLEGGSVPVFYIGDFELLFGGEDGGMAAEECIGILNTLVQEGSTTETDGITTYTLYNYLPELALFTTLPDAQGNGAVEVPTEIEVDGELVETGYTRKNLWGTTPTTGVIQFGQSAAFSSSYMKATITNTEEVQMSAVHPEIENLYKVLGFGIYAAESSEAGAEKRLVAWGPLVDENGDPVTTSNAPILTGRSVPIFYSGGFKLLLGGNADGGSYVPITSVTITSDPNPAVINSFTDTVQLTAEFEPDNATVQTVTWQSNNENIARVNSSSGVVSASSERGKAIITAFAADEITATHEVTLNAVLPTGIEVQADKTSIKKWNKTGIPTQDDDEYIATISYTVTPDTMADADKGVDIEILGDLQEVESLRTTTSVTVYCNKSGSVSGMVRAKLTKKPTMMGITFITITA